MSEVDLPKTFAEEIEEAAGGESIIGIVLGQDYGAKHHHRLPDDVLRRLLTWEEARPLLDYTYDSGYGGEESHPIIAWTERLVIFSCCYDGSEWVASHPRNPMPVWHPHRHGGG